jgi:hypothetical protein
MLDHESQSQHPSPVLPVVPSTPPAKTAADKPFAETPKVVCPVPPEPVKPAPSSSGGTGGKSPSRQVIAFLAIAAILTVGGLIYLVIRASQTSAQPTAPVAVAIPSPSVSATPTKEELARRAFEKATKDHPWVNSLGMKFVPVVPVAS